MPYRDDRPALEARREDLRREIAEMSTRAESLRAVVRDQEAAERELSALEARLARMDARRASLLDDIRIASPCTARWDDMKGDDRARFCPQCQKSVYDISALSRAEAEALVTQSGGSPCIRLYRRADGTVLTADCPDGVRRKRVRLTVLSAAGAGALAAAAFTGLRAYTRVLEAREVVGMRVVPPVHVERPRGGYLMGEGGPEPMSFVEHPVSPPRQTDLVLRYVLEPQPGRAGEVWEVFADGHVVHGIDGGASVVVPATAGTLDGVSEILETARNLRPTGAGAVDAHAVHERFELHGTGEKAISDVERARVFMLVATIVNQARRLHP